MEINVKAGFVAAFICIFFGSTLQAQSYFDSPEVIQTSFTRKMQPKFTDEMMAGGTMVYGGQGCDCGGNSGYGHGPMASSSYGGYADCCDDGPSCVSCCEPDCGMGSSFRINVSGIIDIPLDGTFHSAYDTSITAGALGVAPAVFTAATPFDLSFDEYGFEEVYRTLGGVQANLLMPIDCNTDFFFGYRFTTGQADPITVGQAVSNPTTTPVTYDINAQFSEFNESQIQMGFLNSVCMGERLDFLWGGRMGVGFVDAITASFDIPTVVTLADVPFYDDSTTLTFGFNYGLQYNIGCHLSAHILTGLEYRTRLEQDDSLLSTYGLQDINNGSGFAAIPVYMGFTYCR